MENLRTKLCAGFVISLFFTINFFFSMRDERFAEAALEALLTVMLGAYYICNLLYVIVLKLTAIHTELATLNMVQSGNDVLSTTDEEGAQ